MNDGGKIRDYIKPGDYVQAESLLESRVEEGIVKEDSEGVLRVKTSGANPHGPDGLPVNAQWVNIIMWEDRS